MRFSKKCILLLSVTICCLFNVSLSGQENQKKPTRQSSFEAFSQGKYEAAYKEFSELLKTYTKDPLYKYYSGVCLVMLEKEPDKASTLIEQSLEGASAVKSISNDAWFYLGRARQMAGNYLAAIEAYNFFTEEAGKKTAKELEVPQYIQQCNEKKGAIAVVKKEEPSKPEVSAQQAAVSDPVPASVAGAAAPVVLVVPEKKYTQRQTVSTEYELILSKALEYQVKADSLNALAAKEKENLENLNPSEKQKSVAAISSYEAQASSYQKMADEKYNEARIAMNPQLQKNAATASPVSPQASSSTVPASAPVVALSASAVPPGALSMFEVLAKPVTDPKAKVAIDSPIPAGLVYRIQMGVFRNPVAPSFFKGLAPVQGFRIAGTDKTTYYVGIFRKIDDARKALNTVKAKGFKDSFIVAIADGKTVSSDRAAIMEKEWGNRPLAGTAGSANVAAADTIPPELIFRVEVLRSVKPIKDDAVESIRKVAGNRGLDIRTAEDGKTSYLIGKFITYESAAEYTGLLVKNGYSEAKVVAWLGDKEIPVDKAKQLFEDTR